VEISHFLRSRPRTTALALLFPVVAAVVALLILVNQPTRYTGTATVSVPSSSANSASRVGLFVADFVELARSGAVLNEVARSTGETRTELDEGLEVARIGQSSLFPVVYTGDRQRAVEPVVRAVIAGTFGNLVEVSDSDAEFQAASEAYQAAVAERSAYQDEIGTLQPDSDYTDLSSRIRSLQITPEIGGAAIIARLSAQRDALVPQIRRMQELDQAVQDAADQRDEAERVSLSLQREASESQSSSTIQDLVVLEESRTGRVLQGVGVAAVAGLLVGVAALVLPDLLHRRREPSPDAPAGSVPSRPTLATGARDAS
jgi:hypothetical protein